MAKKILIGLIVLLFLYIISPFIVAVGMGAIFAVLFYPWMKRIEPKKFPNSLAAALFTLTVTLLFFLPIGVLTVGGVKSGLKELRQIKNMSEQLPPGEGAASPTEEVLDRVFGFLKVEKLLHEVAKFAPIDPVEVSSQAKDLVVGLASHAGDALSAFIGRLPSMAVSFSVFLFTLYYFLADGVRLVYLVRQRSFFTALETERLIGVFSGLCRSVILASFISGGVQAAIATAVSASVGYKQVTTVFLVVFVASFIPLLGTFPIVISMALYELFTGHTVGGTVLAGTAFLVAGIDNVIRPLVIRGSSNLHPLLGFVSALGGVEALGIAGIFIGPVICGLFVEILAMSRENSTIPKQNSI